MRFENLEIENIIKLSNSSKKINKIPGSTKFENVN